MAQTPPHAREHIETTVTQHEVAAKITAARIRRIAGQVEAGDFDPAHVRAMALALFALGEQVTKLGDAEQCAARHPACNENAARETAA